MFGELRRRLPAAPEGRSQRTSSSALEVKVKRRHTAVMERAMTIGQLAARCGVRTSALRFYEDYGLLRSDRTSSGHRRYAQSALRQVAFIVFAQKVGLTLDEVGVLLERLPSRRVPQAADWAKLSGPWMSRVDERLAELERLRSDLTGCIGCGCLSLETCQLANPGDRASRRGPGPRYWMADRAPIARKNPAAVGLPLLAASARSGPRSRRASRN